jgi:proline iminopeptidase
MEWHPIDAAAGIAGWARGDGDLPVVVLHGGPGFADYTEALADEVVAANPGRLRVIRYQQRGQPPSTENGPLTVAQFVADLAAVIDRAGNRPAMVIGHSWGAHLAMHAACTIPDRICGLMFIDALGGVGDGGMSTMGPTFIARLGPAVQEELTHLASSDVGDDEKAAARLRLLWPGYFADPRVAPPPPPLTCSARVANEILVDVIRLFGEKALETRLREIQVPSLHLIGRASPIDPTANEQTAAMMPGAQVEMLDTGHFVWIEHPGSVTAATTQLLAALDAASAR